MSDQVTVVIGAGGMGEAIARRLGSGRTLLIGDANSGTLERLRGSLERDGFRVTAEAVDVASRASVKRFAERASGLGRVTQIVHTAGLSPLQGTVDAILRVDLYGVAVVLEELERVVAPSGAGVVISSMSAHLIPGLPQDVERALMHTPTEELLQLPAVQAAAAHGPGGAYAFSKRANILRVAAASRAWGERGARVSSISPGVIATPMGQEELAGPAGARMREMVAASGTGRLGTPHDIAEATAFLLDASFVTGVDLLVDGGVVAGLRAR
jgi:NAD(P)-dependent dehydrogenase (short-subunit alcohol dehydrogenase family)